MRLHHLRVQALQAFAATADVDFDALSEAGLFLLHGETGAGKTTLLDAVCFALFGTMPGAREGVRRERADLADGAVPTEVVLELTLRGERVRITRRPKQERPKQRGTGTTSSPATVLLEAIDPDGSARAVANRHEEVAHELDRLLGMSREQFCQVVLLPQGQFATFLRADSSDREELLARLFGAERFEDAERWLADRRRRADEVLRTAMLTLRDLASRLSQVLSAEPPEGWEGEPSLLTAWADEAQVVADAERAAADGACAEASAARGSADAALETVRSQLRRRERHAVAVRELKAFEAGAAEREADGERLALARKAAVVAPLVERAVHAATAALAARGRATQACATVGGEAGTGGPEALRAAAAQARTKAGEVAAMATVEAAVAAREADLQTGRATEARLRADLAAAQAWLDDAEAQESQLRRAADAGRTAAARASDHDAAAAAAGRRRDAARDRDRAVEGCVRARAAVTKATDAAQAAVTEWLALREARLDGIAAELAETLADDVPCPVCGAVEHPEPAAHGVGGQVTAAQEDAAKAVVDGARVRLQAEERALHELEAAVAGAAAVAGDERAMVLSAAAEVAEAEATATRAAAAGAADAHAALDAFAAERNAVTRRRADEAEALAALLAGLEVQQQAQAGDRARVAAAVGDAGTVAGAVAVHEARAGARDAAAAALEQAAAAEADAHQAGVRADAAAVHAGFADGASAIAAALDEAGIAALQDAIRAHDVGLAERRALVTDPELTAAVQAPDPDEVAAMTAARAAAAADADAGHALERVRGRAENLTALRRELRRRLAAHGPAAEEAATVRGVSMLVDGTSTQNRKRMRLRAYVLAARLEEIAAAASGRLATMSDGRYTLALDDERASHNKRSGLGLRVVDGWTGRDRHPASLSGGETFMASLALALGLADVVAAEAGGARLETLFVDEGFGSLDERALDLALEVLDRLRDGGRAVGVVSHVAELRQRVTAQLYVVKEREGSRVLQRS